MTKALCCIGILFSGVLPVAAEADAGGDSRRAPGRSAWFACTSIPDGIENPAKVMSGGKITELELPKYMTSDAVRIPDDGVIRVVREVPDPEDPAKRKYLVLAEAKIPEGFRDVLIILVPLAKPEGDLIFATKVQDLANFKGGDRLFINLSDTGVRVKFGDTKVVVAPRQANIYEAPVLARPVNMPVMYEFYHPEEKKWKILSASTIVLRPTRREINIFNEGSRLGKIKKHKILFPVQDGRR
ncbi:MAG: hypothetical protein HKN82_03730 [Akkermansiaceae bacterium]|nr:hypothetical protein [Akkermansiaceae bacterium]NNM31267.1 hypothetical protein [Akkermansiaceae bacterium]